MKQRLIGAALALLMCVGTASAQNQLGTGALAAAQDVVAVRPTVQSASVGIQITGTWTGTITFEASVDGTNYVSLLVTSATSGNTATSATSNAAYSAPGGGYQFIRARASAWTSGTANVTFVSGAGSSAAGGGGGGGGGNVNITEVGGNAVTTHVPVTCDNCGGSTPGQATMANSQPVVIASNQSAIPVTGTFWQATQPVSGTFWQTTQPVSNAGLTELAAAINSNLVDVNIVSGAGSGGTAMPDDDAFTAGTTNFTPVGGFYQSTVTPCTDGDACTARITAGRAVTTTIVEADGTVATLAQDSVVGEVAETSGPQLMCYSNTSAPSAVTAGDAQYVWCDASGRPITVGAGTAGTAAGGVVTVQGVASMTPIITTQSLNPCSSGTKVYVAISQATSTQLLTGTASNRTFICAINIMQRAASTQTWSLISGTGTVCATSSSAMHGATTAANGTDGSFQGGDGGSSIMKTDTDADNVCLLQSGTDRINGFLTYVVAANQ